MSEKHQITLVGGPHDGQVLDVQDGTPILIFLSPEPMTQGEFLAAFENLAPEVTVQTTEYAYRRDEKAPWRYLYAGERARA